MRRLLPLVFFFISTCVVAQIRLPRLISDNMVLQREADLKIFGWASQGEKVTMSFNGREYNATASESGEWIISLPRQKAGGPYDLKFSGKNEIVVRNVVFGDVWVCSGQSNMELSIDRVKGRYPEEVATSINAFIRHFEVPDRYDFKQPNSDLVGGQWNESNPENVRSFSAVAYFFARDIYEKHKVPIGLINSALGGSPAEAWMSEEALKSFPHHLKEAYRFRNDSLIQSIEAGDRKRMTDWYATLAGKDVGLRERWEANEVDDNEWNETKVPGYWADGTTGNVNGVVWFTRTFDVIERMTGKEGSIELGRIVDQDSVFINGKFVGTTGYQYPPRRYGLKAGVLTPGKNRITVRVINQSGRGGFVLDKPYFIAVDGDTIDLKGKWKYKVGSTMDALPGQTFIRWKPLGLFNAMVAPLTKLPIKGVIWYQGESNTGAAKEYETLFPALIRDWRTQWKHEFPFLFVQLAGFMERKEKPMESNWAMLREAQRKTLRVANTGMVVAIDLGEWNDIHPENKKDVGQRLALHARKLAYDEKKLVASGPEPVEASFEKNKVIIRFANAQNGLVSRGGPLRYFEISEDGKTFESTEAKIVNNTVVVMTHFATPTVVRYAWADNPDSANLYNIEGLPATPFELRK